MNTAALLAISVALAVAVSIDALCRVIGGAYEMPLWYAPVQIAGLFSLALVWRISKRKDQKK